MKTISKKLSNTFLYGIGDYEKRLYKSFIESTVIDKNDESIQDIRYDVKRGQNTTVLLKVFDSDNVVFLRNNVPQPRAFKVFAASDIKSGDKKTKIFIDMTDVMIFTNGRYEVKPRDLDKLVSYLMSALCYLIYYAEPDRLINSSALIETGNKAFCELFAYCIDSLRIGGVDKVREKTIYLSSLYYQTNILGKDFTNSVEDRAKRISGLNSREIEVIDAQLDSNTFKDIKGFVESLAKIIRCEGSLKIDNFVERWLFLFGTGTQFGMELYPAFSTILTNAYCGAYLNNQKTIEKILGRTLVEYTLALLRLGSELR